MVKVDKRVITDFTEVKTTEPMFFAAFNLFISARQAHVCLQVNVLIIIVVRWPNVKILRAGIKRRASSISKMNQKKTPKKLVFSARKFYMIIFF